MNYYELQLKPEEKKIKKTHTHTHIKEADRERERPFLHRVPSFRDGIRLELN